MVSLHIQEKQLMPIEINEITKVNHYEQRSGTVFL